MFRMTSLFDHQDIGPKKKKRFCRRTILVITFQKGRREKIKEKTDVDMSIKLMFLLDQKRAPFLKVLKTLLVLKLK